VYFTWVLSPKADLIGRAPLCIHIIGTNREDLRSCRPVQYLNSMIHDGQNLSSTSGEPYFVGQQYFDFSASEDCYKMNLRMKGKVLLSFVIDTAFVTLYRPYVLKSRLFCSKWQMQKGFDIKNEWTLHVLHRLEVYSVLAHYCLCLEERPRNW
jgi:hypothetical protein